MTRAILGWFGTFLLLFSLGHSNIENLDVTATMHAGRALWHRGDSGLRGPDQDPQWLGEAALVTEIRRRAALPKPHQWYGKAGENGLTYVWFPMGHVWLMVPPVVGGDVLHDAFPSVEEAFRDRAAPGQPYLAGQFVFAQGLAAILPALFGAASLLLLYGIARAFGAGARDALMTCLAIGLATQFFPLTRENLSDGPGLCFLLGALFATVRAACGQASARLMLLGGLSAGFAVLSRYQLATLVPFFGLAIGLAGWKRQQWRDLLWFMLGGMPCLVLLLTVNYLRYGDVTDTGYPQAESWFNYPIYFGAVKILFAAGKGILWFSPLLWLALPLLVRRRSSVQLGWLAAVVFVIQLGMFSSTNGWQSGQCWGVRYVTTGVVVLLAIVLPQLKPWQHHRKLFAVLAGVGLLVNITGVIAPTRGHNQLAGQAVTAMYQREFENGQISQKDWDNLDAADHFFFLPRFSPLHANWTYAVRSWRGDFEDDQERPVHGSANTIEPLFGIEAVTEAQGTAPVYWEDRGGRHLWWVFWGRLLGRHPLLLFLPVVTAGSLLLWLGWPGRRKTAQP